MTSPPRILAVHVDSRAPLDVRDFAVEQRMSSLFEVKLTAFSSDDDVDFDAVVGRPASFSIQSGAEGAGAARLWTGLCKHIEQVAVAGAGLSTYQITIVPELWLLTQRRNHRMFQQMSELDIVRKIVGEWGIDPDLRVTGVYKKREYRVQYGESDYAFVCRMLEDAGISFFFEQGEAETRLVLTDAPQAASPRAAIPFRDDTTLSLAREYVTKLHVGQRVRPGRVTLRDHDTRLAPNYPLVAAAAAPGAGVEGRLEQFHYVPGAFSFGTDQGEDMPHGDDRGKTRSDERAGSALAAKRLEAERSSAKACSFETSVADLAPGVVTSILDYPRSDLAGKPLLVVESSLRGDVHGAWTHRCEARRADVAYRPPLTTEKPKISGVESATVVGPAGEEIHTDELGRVRVHFHWDRESKMNQNSSCWIHVSHPWGGAGYGGSNLPRIGQEVLVDFLGGDPDKPIITGRVYTSLQKTPYSLPANKTQSGWKSNSSPSTGGYNEMMFEDAAGRELVRMQAEKDLHKLVKNDEVVTIGNNRTKQVGVDDSFTVGNNRTKTVQNDEVVTIGNNRNKTVQVDENVMIGNNHTRSVQNDESVTIGNNHTRSVQVDENVTIGNDHTRSVANDESVTIGNNHTRSVQADESVTIGNDHTRSVANDESVTIGNDHTRQVKGTEAATIGQDLVHTVLANAREVTGMMKNVSVGVSRTTQVGMNDTTMVGGTHMIMVTPSGESCTLLGSTSFIMNADHQCAQTTGGALLDLSAKTITLDAGPKVTISEPMGVTDARSITLDSGAGSTITMEKNKIELAVGDNKITITDKEITIHGKTVDVKGKPINLNC